MKSRTSSLASAFTLIEVLVVIALLGVVASFSVLMGTDALARATAHSERDLVVTLLEGARARSLANIDETPHGLHIDASSYIVFMGSAYSAGDPDNESTPKDSAVTVSGPTDIIFDPLSGNVGTGEGTLLFADGTSEASIDINEQGRIDW
jgi:prepilin-type N-terminal cleavage/methylation domain-containing protein